MSDKGKGTVTLIMCFLAAIAIVIGILVWNTHYTLRGIFVGFGVGIACTVVAYRVIEWIGLHGRAEVPPPKQ